MTATIDGQPPQLFEGRPPLELLVPIYAKSHYERGASIAARYAAGWGLPIRLVHVRALEGPSAFDGVDTATEALRAANPDVLIDGVEVENDDIGAGVAKAATDDSLIFLASDEGSQWLERDSVGEKVVQAATDLVVLCGPGCEEPPVGTSVVVPLDGSPRAAAAIKAGVAVAASTGSKLWVITVVPPATVEAVAKLRAEGEQVSESAYLRSVAGELAKSGVDVGWEVIHHGDPVAGISSFVRDQSSAMVVAATQGQTGVARRLFGSVCMGLVERGPVPVMVIKADVERSDALPEGGATGV